MQDDNNPNPSPENDSTHDVSKEAKSPEATPNASSQNQDASYFPPPTTLPTGPGQREEPVTGYSINKPRLNASNDPILARKDFTIAYALLYFLGMFGAHKFYLRQSTNAVIYIGAYLVFSMLTLVFIGWLGVAFMLVMIYADIRTLPWQTEEIKAGRNVPLFAPLKMAFS